MMDPVVSSKFGKRPLLDMPALHVESDSRVEISSLQPRPKPDFGSLPSIIYRSEGLSQPPPVPAMPLNPGMNMPHPMTAPAALPPIPGMPAPAGMYPSPPTYQQPPYRPPTMVPPQMMGAPPMPSMQQPPMYPPMQPPYQGQPYYGAGGVPPQGGMPPYPQAVAPRTPVPHNFHVEGVLQFGQLTTIHFRDKTSNFQGIPEYLRNELLTTYGRYPVTDIRIVAINGQFHIYAKPRKGDDVDEFSEYGGPGSPDTRMIGFNEVRGEPRDLYPMRR